MGDAPAIGLRHAADTLRRAGVRFALAGGLAVAIRGEPRFTADIDIVVGVPSDREMEALVFRLRDAGFRVITLLPVARAEELLAMKVLSMTDRRPQDRMDAIGLVLVNERLDLDAVREDLQQIAERGFHREQDLLAKLQSILDAARTA